MSRSLVAHDSSDGLAPAARLAPAPPDSYHGLILGAAGIYRCLLLYTDFPNVLLNLMDSPENEDLVSVWLWWKFKAWLRWKWMVRKLLRCEFLNQVVETRFDLQYDEWEDWEEREYKPVSYTHLTLPTNREV